MSIHAVRDGRGKVRAWRVRWRYGGTRDGEAYSLTLDLQNDAKALQRALEERGYRVRRSDPEVLDRSIITGRVGSKGATGPTFGEVAEAYLNSRVKMKPATRHGMECTLRTQFAGWHDRPVDSLTKVDAATLLREAGARLRNVQPVWRIARSVMRYAEQSRLIEASPFALLPEPETPASPALFLTDAEVSRLLGAATQERMWLILRVALDSGLRQSEICALKVRDLMDVESARPYLNARGGITRGASERWVEGNGKSLKSQRRVPIPRGLMDDLVAYCAGHGGEFVFQSEAGRFTTPSIVYRMFTRMLDREAEEARRAKVAPLPHVRFHDLRHTHASRLLAAGIPMMEVSRRLGHSSTAVTDRVYGHLDPASADRVIDVLESFEAPRRLHAV